MKYKSLIIEEDKKLAPMTTMKLGGNAKYFTVVNDKNQVQEAIDFAKLNDLEIFVLGGGSNILINDELFEGLVIKNEILGIRELYEDDSSIEFKINSGENWDDFVRMAVLERGLSGIEAMVFIPGTVGALPVQNVGAYGQEIGDVFMSLEAIEIATGQVINMQKEDCRFSYRDSIFRAEAAGKYFITSIRIILNKNYDKQDFYPAIKNYFKGQSIDLSDVTPKEILFAVEEIRRNKLPDPKVVASAGSFFKNAIIDKTKADALAEEYGNNIPLFDLKNGKFKMSSGWLIERAGLKGQQMYGMKVHDKNALVLTNISATDFSCLVAARADIIEAVKAKFDIELIQEPLEI